MYTSAHAAAFAGRARLTARAWIETSRRTSTPNCTTVARASRRARGLKRIDQLEPELRLMVARASRRARGLKRILGGEWFSDIESRAPHGARVD